MYARAILIAEWNPTELSWYRVKPVAGWCAPSQGAPNFGAPLLGHESRRPGVNHGAPTIWIMKNDLTNRQYLNSSSFFARGLIKRNAKYIEPNLDLASARKNPTLVCQNLYILQGLPIDIGKGNVQMILQICPSQWAWIILESYVESNRENPPHNNHTGLRIPLGPGSVAPSTR